MFKLLGTTFIAFFIFTGTVNADILISPAGGGTTANLFDYNQTITCNNWEITSITLKQNGNSNNENATITLNGVVSDTHDIPNFLYDDVVYTFPSPVSCNGLTAFFFHTDYKMSVTWGLGSYPNGEWSFDNTKDLRMTVQGIAIIAPSFIREGTGFYFFGESEPSENAVGNTATALQGNLGVNLNSIWQVVLLSMGIVLSFYVMQKIIGLFAYAYYDDKPKNRKRKR